MLVPEPNVASKDTESPLYHKGSFVINVYFLQRKAV